MKPRVEQDENQTDVGSYFKAESFRATCLFASSNKLRSEIDAGVGDVMAFAKEIAG
jgi:hypothetical protein